MNYERACSVISPKRKTPPGHFGPSKEMVEYAEAEEKKRVKQMEIIFKRVKIFEHRRAKLALEN